MLVLFLIDQAENADWFCLLQADADVPVSPEDVPELKVAVASRSIRPPLSLSEFPEAVDDYTVLTEATEDKVAGATSADDV